MPFFFVQRESELVITNLSDLSSSKATEQPQPTIIWKKQNHGENSGWKLPQEVSNSISFSKHGYLRIGCSGLFSIWVSKIFKKTAQLWETWCTACLSSLWKPFHHHEHLISTHISCPPITRENRLAFSSWQLSHSYWVTRSVRT